MKQVETSRSGRKLFNQSFMKCRFWVLRCERPSSMPVAGLFRCGSPYWKCFTSSCRWWASSQNTTCTPSLKTNIAIIAPENGWLTDVCPSLLGLNGLCPGVNSLLVLRECRIFKFLDPTCQKRTFTAVETNWFVERFGSFAENHWFGVLRLRCFLCFCFQILANQWNNGH